MEKYLIVAKDNRIPPVLEGLDYDIISQSEFITRASSDEGIDIDSGIFFNIDSLTEDIYEALRDGIDIPITYYRFLDQDVSLDFLVEEGISEYPVEQETIEEPEVEGQYIPQEKEPVYDEPEKELVDSKEEVTNEAENTATIVGDLEVADGGSTEVDNTKLDKDRLSNLLDTDALDVEDKKRGDTPAKVILFGSSKGGTGKTFTCLLSAYRYARQHPNERIALADFDIIDGQVGITINRNNPTMADYYKQYINGNDTFGYLKNIVVKNEHFSANLDFYLAPPMDVPEITNDQEFWKNVFTLLITNYDTVFFDSGIDYLGKQPISKLYKIADKIILTSNTSINSVKSIIRQLQTLSGKRRNNVFSPEEKITDRVNLVLTRVSSNNATNDIVIENLTKYAPIVAAFGNIDDQISKSQWYQQWEIWDSNTKVLSYLDRITDFGEDD